MEHNNWVECIIKDYVKHYPQLHDVSTAWNEPLIAAAAADDPLFMDLKTQVDPNHLLPTDMLPGARSVICYFLPFASSIGRSNKPGGPCSDEWAWAYLETNRLINDLNAHIQAELSRKGFRSAITPATHNFDEETLISNWSHRHIAVVAGLGTMGLNRMLITDQGCCGRLGSLVTDLPVIPTPRSEVGGCLYFYNKSCSQCIKNCPLGALHNDEFDRYKCYDLLLQNAEIHKDKGFADACGKCVTRIPCSFINPVKKLLAKQLMI
ncbi:MAG: epoxyqueuosine reductase [Syntrophomonadaceae bacterium]|nr:epoxyqueuosine reductase [Syntrophomonadaceae bacterium]